MEKLNLVKSTFDQLPNNIEAEQAVLGSILVSNEIFDDVSPIVNSKNFFDPMHQKVLSANRFRLIKSYICRSQSMKRIQSITSRGWTPSGWPGPLGWR